ISAGKCSKGFTYSPFPIPYHLICCLARTAVYTIVAKRKTTKHATAKTKRYDGATKPQIAIAAAMGTKETSGTSKAIRNALIPSSANLLRTVPVNTKKGMKPSTPAKTPHTPARITKPKPFFQQPLLKLYS
ncbi:MAG: hypothetical protein LBC23_03475, partial [Coriobacteriales bacterium]|nr:hypothetical protein [Coriobacteriales bacterium]